ncbi:hypothetical protein TCT1_05300 [Xenorhabdus sp. TCT-1]|uniref:Transposase n=1 Tax=Xenorhabdus taiwanensis TaxID=3085177 RepID=A0ABN7BZR0_9GAMM|nr:hypothetical protein TCT1_05300 [Xenorhabdus sp. TCT-1]
MWICQKCLEPGSLYSAILLMKYHMCDQGHDYGEKKLRVRSIENDHDYPHMCYLTPYYVI